MSSTTKVSPNSGEPPKHRACDECRTRKLACSKEPDGCARCKREGIRCHYSPQKPMGRPRKRQHVETVAEDDAPNTDAEAEIDWSFLDAETPSLNFFDLLGPDFAAQAQQMSQPRAPAPAPIPLSQAPPVIDPVPNPHNPPKAGWHFDLGNIDFNANPIPADPIPVDPLIAATTVDFSHLSPPSLQTDNGSFTSHSANTPESQGHGTHGHGHSHSHAHGSADRPDPHSVVSMENRLCGCLANMYLALDSLQHLPKTVGPAMRVARNAARAAHDVMSCPTCSPPNFADVHMKPSVQAFQNMMMLGALLPTLANAYNRILGMVDEEAARADAQHRELAFSLEEYGGLWGRLGELELVCGTTAALNGTVLDPITWRRTVRALLRVDVYGINNPPTVTGQPPTLDQPAWGIEMVQIGLKDIVIHMDERSRIRHEAMDAAVATGIIAEPECHGHMPMAPGEKHTCQRIIDIARKAIDDLVIA